jgi:hypothetical protein
MGRLLPIEVPSYRNEHGVARYARDLRCKRLQRGATRGKSRPQARGFGRLSMTNCGGPRTGSRTMFAKPLRFYLVAVMLMLHALYFHYGPGDNCRAGDDRHPSPESHCLYQLDYFSHHDLPLAATFISIPVDADAARLLPANLRNRPFSGPPSPPKAPEPSSPSSYDDAPYRLWASLAGRSPMAN